MSEIQELCLRKIVVLTDTEFTRKYYPEKIGTEARVDLMPEDSSADDYLLVSKDDGLVMRIPRNSFRLPTKEISVSSSVKAGVYNSPISVMDVYSSKAPAEEMSEGQIAPVNAMSLRVGAPVRLLDNDSTRNRVPHLVNTIGYIREVPVHPATWFKVEFPGDENKVMTFRPSALQAVDESGRPLIALLPRRAAAGVSSAKQSPELHGYGQQRSRANSAVSFSLPSAMTLPPVALRTSAASNNKKQQVLLTSTDPDSWIDRRVTVLTGRVKGVSGTIVSSGNGWVQLQSCPGRELIAKRAAELALTPDDEQGSDQGYEEDDDNKQTGRHKKRLFGRFVHQQPAASVFSIEPKRVRLEDYTTFAHQQQFCASKAVKQEHKRPNLSSWQTKLNAALFLPSATDHTFSNNDGHRRSYEQVKMKQQVQSTVVTYKRSNANPKEVDQNDPVCNNCTLHKWPGAKFCWNEACSASPIFVERFEKKSPSKLASGSKIKTSPSVEQLQHGFDDESNQLQSESPIISEMMQEDGQQLVAVDEVPDSNASDSSTITAGFCAEEGDDDEMDTTTVADGEDGSSPMIMPSMSVVSGKGHHYYSSGLMAVHY